MNEDIENQFQKKFEEQIKICSSDTIYEEIRERYEAIINNKNNNNNNIKPLSIQIKPISWILHILGINK